MLFKNTKKKIYRFLLRYNIYHIYIGIDFILYSKKEDRMKNIYKIKIKIIYTAVYKIVHLYF